MDFRGRNDGTACLGPCQYDSSPRWFSERGNEAHYCYLVDASRATREVLGLARSRKCDTVVIGRDSLSWLGELIHGDPAEEIVRQGKGFTIWVVE